MKGLCLAAVVATTLCWAGAARSDPADEARTAEESGSSKDAVAFALYEKATSALRDGSFAAAARDYARADALSPTRAALKAALLAVLKTDDAALGMTLAGRTAREPFDEELTELAKRARQRFGDRAGQLVVVCDGCQASVDGRAVEPGTATWHSLGEHRVTTTVAGQSEEQRVTVVADRVISLGPSAAPGDPAPTTPPPPTAPRDSAEGRDGVSPAFFWIGLGITLAAGAGTIVSFVDLRNIHRDFEATPSPVLADEGNDAQLRTRVLLGVTGGLAVGTALVGALAVDWGGEDESIGLVVDGRGLALRLRW